MSCPHQTIIFEEQASVGFSTRATRLPDGTYVASDKDLNPTSWHYQGDLPSTYTFYCLTCSATWEADYVPSEERFIRGRRLV